MMQRIVQYQSMVLGMDNTTLKLPVIQEVEQNLPARVDYWPESVNNDKIKPYYFVQRSYTLCLTILCSLICVD